MKAIAIACEHGKKFGIRQKLCFCSNERSSNLASKLGLVPSPPGCYILVALGHKVDMILNAVFPEVECEA